MTLCVNARVNEPLTPSLIFIDSKIRAWPKAAYRQALPTPQSLGGLVPSPAIPPPHTTGKHEECAIPPTVPIAGVHLALV
jgi:hypothetical protein